MKQNHNTHPQGNNNSSPLEMGTLGMTLFLASLSMLFAASILGYLVIRFQADQWPPAGMPALPKGLWLSTLLIILSSLTMQKACNAVQRNVQAALKRNILYTLLLGFIFLIMQSWNWYHLVQAEFLMSTNLYAFTFYLLTGLHAVHVLGGLIPLLITALRAYNNVYNAVHFGGIKYCTMYWHFLGIVWLVMFLILLTV